MNQPGSAGHKSEVMMSPASRSTWRGFSFPIAAGFAHAIAATCNEAIAAAHHSVRHCRALRGAAMTDVVRLCKPASSRLDFPGTDLTVFVELNDGELSMTVNKADKSVYRVVLEQATLPIENDWLADMFMRDDRVQLGRILLGRRRLRRYPQYRARLDVAAGRPFGRRSATATAIASAMTPTSVRSPRAPWRS